MDKIEFELLGKSGYKPPQNPEEAVIETFKNQFTERSYLVQFDCLDFTSLCPVTGQPDFAKIKIEYIPNELCIETKSLKYYLHSFRNYQGFNEKIINTMLTKFIDVCQPKWMRIKGEFAARGGIVLSATAEYPELDLNRITE